jgi:predicted kinase
MSPPVPPSPWEFPFVPQAHNGWRVDWTGLNDRFEAVRQLAACPQDPVHHAEGDVGTHTRMVCDALAQSDAWRALPADARSSLFAATLLHDVAKPVCTKLENGRLTSRGHAAKGAQLARCLLWELWPEESSPAFFQMRESIVGLVRHHGLPLYFLERPDPRRAVIEASISTRLDWVAMIAEADVVGRVCRDRAELLDRVALFREYAAEHGCLAQPCVFASDHSRWMYFRRPDQHPAVHWHDDARFEVTLMSGLPASGKDHWIRAHCGRLPVISLDDIREEFDVSPGDEQGTVANAARDRARAFLRADQPFVWNATNTTTQMRRQLVDLFADYGARTRIIYVETSPAELERRNQRRTQPVPSAVISRLRQRLEIPALAEAPGVDIHAE